MRRLALLATLIAALVAAPGANAAVTSVFTNTTSPVACTAQANGQRFCSGTGSRVPSFDATPIDVAVALPAEPASGVDGGFPVIGIFHGWGGSKITPGSAAAQRFVAQGYAVFSITDRGWGFSCGPNVGTPKPAACANGYIHLLHNAYEVRDVQYLLGRLADDGVIDPQRIGATGGSYGGGMSLQLGALKDRVALPDGSLIPWTSPQGKALRIAGTAPEFGWSDLMQALMPNGSSLDYVADAPYVGPNGDRRVGIQKQNWNGSLLQAGQFLGFYAPAGSDPTADIVGWNALNSTGGPYDGVAGAQAQIGELKNHGAYYTDLSEPPAPALISNGWNDDLFPVDEALRYYNKVRAAHPGAAIKMFHLNFGHSPRANGIAADVARLTAAEDTWFAHYVRGDGAAPAAVHGGVDILTSTCPPAAAGTQYTAANWASLAPGEIRVDGVAPQVVQAPGSAPSNAFTSGNVCTTTSSADNASAATYKADPAPAGGFTIAGSPTIVADLTVAGANDMIAARLYDVDPADGQRLIARGLYRPTGVGAGPTRQVFQLHPQAYKVLDGHIVKLELLSQDSTYARLAPGRQSITVESLQLRLPTIDQPGDAGGLVQAPAAKVVPAGFVLARDVASSVPGIPAISVGATPNAGVFSLGWNASDPATDLTYTLEHRDADDADWSDVAGGLSAPARALAPEAEGTWRYRVRSENGGVASAFSDASAAVVVDRSAPAAPSLSADRLPDYSGGGGWFKDSVTVSFAANGDPALQDGSAGTGVDPASVPAAATRSTSGAHTVSGTVADRVGNESAAGSLDVQVDAAAPSVSVTCPAAVLLGATEVIATVAASDAHSGLATDPSGVVGVPTGAVGPAITSATATDHVGHSAGASCTTAVRYLFGGLQEPANPDGSSVFKLGSTIPSRFRLTDAAGDGVAGAIARLEVLKVTAAVGGLNEAEVVLPADDGNLFKDQGDGKYHFNLNTKALTAGTWILNVVLDDGTEYPTRIGLR